MEYFVLCIDYGRDGREAIVHPEDTRRATVDRVREALGDRQSIAFIHQIRDCTVEDVTNELLKEAGFYEPEPVPVDHLAARWDYIRGVREAAE